MVDAQLRCEVQREHGMRPAAFLVHVGASHRTIGPSDGHPTKHSVGGLTYANGQSGTVEHLTQWRLADVEGVGIRCEQVNYHLIVDLEKGYRDAEPHCAPVRFAVLKYFAHRLLDDADFLLSLRVDARAS